ncbi:MAG: gamma-glutamylcyclotransferase [Cuspidothrix sp.]
MMNIFVYGTLKPGEGNYQKYCAGKVVEVQKAIVNGKIYALPMGYPAMTPGEGKVEGYLLTFPDSSYLRTLDDLEDYQANRRQSKNLYNRHYIEVYNLNGSSLGFAWVYFMTSEKIYQLGGVMLNGCWTGNN